MMRSLIDRLSSGAEMTVGEKILAGIEVSVFSMAIVFAVLILLMFIIKWMGDVVANSEKKAQEQESAAAPNQPTTEPVIAQNTTDESEVVAAIVAAISAMSEGSDCKIVIRNITRANESWASAGLLEQINSRL